MIARQSRTIPTMPTTDSITVAEAARELGVTPRRVRALIAAGRLRAELVNPRLYLVRRRDLARVADRRPGRPATKKGGKR